MTHLTHSTGLPYSSEDYLPKRFLNLVRIGTYPDNGYNYEKNTGESIADVMLFHIEKLPQKIGSLITDPRIVTLAISALAILAVSLAFYPGLTVLYIKTAIAAIPFPPAWAIKFAAYLLSVETILGYTLRAESRFYNKSLTSQIPGFNS